MCGGAIISGLIPVKRGRKLTAEDLWSELDTLSDLLGLDCGNGKDPFTQFDNTEAGSKARKLEKGMIFASGFSSKFGCFCLFSFCRKPCFSICFLHVVDYMSVYVVLQWSFATCMNGLKN